MVDSTKDLIRDIQIYRKIYLYRKKYFTHLAENIFPKSAKKVVDVYGCVRSVIGLLQMMITLS